MQVNSFSPSHSFPTASKYTTSSTTADSNKKTCQGCSLSAPSSKQTVYSRSLKSVTQRENSPVSKPLEEKPNPLAAMFGMIGF